ncbi:uncharacterized protein MONBRDRAFT_25127 [Monosiga brevicollis MX1]|uniref:EXPERA domain-containing protein n=1 Tax=Monosiga brevicollis TaxID=81824 RepID=A9UYH6_MONBE|nr:uncharacterized protein MONBRDRAFT_25127 [Monosiga brevicollis MX1]EDQ89608.1 predicted protein [Monosiga brevicollis MX1]|eukprot:XP_001745637.1 hypothetical protein [Monosiga brevicollis MX1]
MARALSWTDQVHYWFFASHIPITLLMDSQAILPPSLVPGSISSLQRFYVETFQDPLMANPPVWFKSMVTCELLIQLPFFFWACRAIKNGAHQALNSIVWYHINLGDNSIRLPGLLYGAHVATTLVPILGEFLFGFPAANLSTTQRLALVALYSPYLLVPIHYAWHLLRHPKPYGTHRD